MRRMYSENQLLKSIEKESQENGLKVFENIVDKDGHNRFIEGDLEFTDYVPEGANLVYGKWSLSGSHLLIVLAGNVLNTTVIPSSTVWCIIDLPQWIKDKIYPIVNEDISSISASLYAADGTTQSLYAFLRKTSAGQIRIVSSSLTLTKDRNFRIAFDLLIDNE